MSGLDLARLQPEEERLVWSLREIQDPRHRSALLGLLDDLVAFVGAPHCPESQADGVPCGSASMSCEQCRQVLVTIDELRLWIREG